MANKPATDKSKYKVIARANLPMKDKEVLQEKGDTLAAIFVSRSSETILDERTGKEKIRNRLVLLDPETGDKYGIFEDGGMKVALSDVSPWDFVLFTYLGQIDMPKHPGQRVNQYDVHFLEKTSEVKAVIAKAREQIAARQGMGEATTQSASA